MTVFQKDLYSLKYVTSGATEEAAPVAQTVWGKQVAFLQELHFESRALFIWIETVFKQFSSNLNLKFLWEMVPMLPPMKKRQKESRPF
jgi:hypothetical protein